MMRPFERFETLLHAVACICLAVMAVLIACDAAARSIANTPIPIQFELTEMYLMPALATLSLSYVYREGGHISLDFVSERALGWARRPIRLALCLLSLAFFGLLAFRSGKFALEAYQRNDIYLGAIDWPMYVAYLSAPLGTATLSIRLAIESFRHGDSTTKTAM